MENIGVSNKAELRHLLTLFAGFQTVEEGHRLSALVFGAQQARHFSFDHIRESSERIDLSPDKRGQTQYGQPYTLKKRGNQTCQLRCTDGTLTMPNCVLIFEEVSHV